MEIWKPLVKYRYSDERNEFKYHTDFALREDEIIEISINGKMLIKEKMPKGEIHKFHFEMAEEVFEDEEIK